MGAGPGTPEVTVVVCTRDGAARLRPTLDHLGAALDEADRKSTRLNSSHT